MVSCWTRWSFIRPLSLYRTAISSLFFFFFFNDTATTEIYTLSLHDALPIYCRRISPATQAQVHNWVLLTWALAPRSEEHTSELQSHSDLVCRLLLEKKKKIKKVR